MIFKSYIRKVAYKYHLTVMVIDIASISELARLKKLKKGSKIGDQ